jgi:prophage regulatory protein
MKLLPKKAVREKIGFSFAHIDRLEDAGKLPKRIKVGFRVFWLDSEIDDWIKERIAERDHS